MQPQETFTFWSTWLHRYQSKPCGKQGLGKSQWVTDHCQKELLLSLWEEQIPWKGQTFSFALKIPGCVLESSWKIQRVVAGRPLHPTFPKCHLWTGTFTGEGPSLRLVFITHWQELFNTETPDKKLQHLHKALNINELLRAAFALWACASWNWV